MPNEIVINDNTNRTENIATLNSTHDSSNDENENDDYHQTLNQIITQQDHFVDIKPLTPAADTADGVDVGVDVGVGVDANDCIILMNEGNPKNSSACPSINFVSNFNKSTNDDGINDFVDDDDAYGDGDSLRSDECQTEVDNKSMTPTTKIDAFAMKFPMQHLAIDDAQKFPCTQINESMNNPFKKEKISSTQQQQQQSYTTTIANSTNLKLTKFPLQIINYKNFPITNMTCDRFFDKQQQQGEEEEQHQHSTEINFGGNSLNSLKFMCEQNKSFECQLQRAATISTFSMDFHEKKQKNVQKTTTTTTTTYPPTSTSISTPIVIIKKNITNINTVKPTFMTQSPDLVADTTKYGHDVVHQQHQQQQQQQEAQVHNDVQVQSNNDSGQERTSNNDHIVVSAHDGIGIGIAVDVDIRPTETKIMDDILNILPQNQEKHATTTNTNQPNTNNYFEHFELLSICELSNVSQEFSGSPLLTTISPAPAPSPSPPPIPTSMPLAIGMGGLGSSLQEQQTLISAERTTSFSNCSASLLNTPTTASIDDERHAQPNADGGGCGGGLDDFNDFDGLDGPDSLEQKSFARQFCSDVRDTSSQEVLADIACRDHIGTCTLVAPNLDIPTTTPRTFQSICLFATTNQQQQQQQQPSPLPSKSKSSDFVAHRLTSCLPFVPFRFYCRIPTSATTLLLPSPSPSPIPIPSPIPLRSHSPLQSSLYDELPKFELLSNCCAAAVHNRAEFNEWIKLVCRSVITPHSPESRSTTAPFLFEYLQKQIADSVGAKNSTSNELPEFEACIGGVEEQQQQQQQHGSAEMTITTFEEHEEVEEEEGVQQRSEPSSPVTRSTGGEKDSNPSTDPFDEMKLEMRSTKGALPGTVHDRLRSSVLSSNATTPPAGTSTLLRSYPTLPEQTSNSIARSQSGTLAKKPLRLSNDLKPQILARSALPERLPCRSDVTLDTVSPLRTEYPVSRSVSVDTVATDSMSQSRARFRRQRRMYSQDSTEQPEDPIERLNRLRARISGALSEVKGVLNKYSTETEPNETSTATTTTPKKEQPKPDEGPVTFRFVRKVRRRSVFPEEDEASEKTAKDAPTEQNEEKQKLPSESDKKSHEIEKEKSPTPNTQCSPSVADPLQKIPPTFPTIEEEKTTSKGLTIDSIPAATRRASFGAPEDKTSNKLAVDIKAQRRPSDSAAIIKSQQQLPTKKQLSTKKSVTQSKPPQSVEVQEKSAPKANATTTTENMVQHPTPKITVETTPQTTKPKKQRASIKRNESLRRASIAAVEESKIEPPVQPNIPLEVKAQRRPSDSAAFIKKKSRTVTATASTATATVKTNATTNIRRSSIKSGTAASGSVAASSSGTKNCHKDDAKASKAPKQSVIDATPFTAVIHDETPITSSPPSQSSSSLQSMAKVIGMPTKPTSTTTAIAPPAKYTPIIDTETATATTTAAAIESNDHNISKSATPINTSPDNEADSQPEHQKPRGGASAVLSPSIINNNNNSSSKIIAPKPTPVTSVANKQPLEPLTAVNTTNQAKILSEKSEISEKSLPDNNNVEAESENSKKLIHQQKKSVTAKKAKIEATPQSTDQQVVISNSALAVDTTTATAGEITTIPVKANENSETTATKSLSEVNKTTNSAAVGSATLEAKIVAVEIAASPTVTKVDSATVEYNSAIQTTIGAGTTPPTSTVTKSKSESESPSESVVAQQSTSESIKTAMPELQVSPAPVKAVQLHPHVDSKVSAPFNLPKEEFPKKRIIFKKLVRKNSTDKPASKINATVAENNSQHPTISPPATQTESTAEIVEPPQSPESPQLELEVEVEASDETLPPEPPAPPKKPRKVKKRVIIKRQKRKLSISDTTFFSQEPSLLPAGTANDVETLEKAIAYVTDEEDDQTEEPIPEPLKPCIRQREYQVGDLVMYAERFKRTQVRWKKGKVLDRITSISYKLEIDGKEVPAHISYIKRFTDRKVNFGGKEYLEIDYEQIAEEEDRARSYSIWNMV